VSYPAGALARYASASVTTATPERLLVMLYDRLLLDLARAEEAQRTGDRRTAHTQLLHAQDIVTELLSSLRPQAWDGGPRLAAIYTWLLTELVEANVTGDAARTAACRDAVQPLREAWAEAATTLLAARATPVAG
jgi:flagellar secretion chaperone FliS